jgi:hypothetical protein
MLLCTLLLLLMLVSWCEHNGATRVKVYPTHVMHWFTIGRAESGVAPAADCRSRGLERSVGGGGRAEVATNSPTPSPAPAV